MRDPLIDKLVSELKPVKPATSARLFLSAALLFGLSLVAVTVFFGLRHDLSLAVVWKPLMFAFPLLAALGVMFSLYSPAGKPAKTLWAFVMLAAGIFCWQAVGQLSAEGFTQARAVLFDPRALHCLAAIMAFGFVGMLALWFVWLSKSATSSPRLLGAACGLAAGAMAASAYAFHCTQDAILYVTAYYCLPVMLLTGLGAWLGAKRLRW